MALERDTEKGLSPASSSLAGESDQQAEQDPNIVDFDGPDDPENPLNWTFYKKWGMVLLISAITFLTPLASSMFAPGVPEVMKDFGSTNDMLEGFMVSVYVLGFSFGPLSRSKTTRTLVKPMLTRQSLHPCRKCSAAYLCTIRATCSSSSSRSRLLFPPTWACS